jgi:hypothetical protein
MKTCWRAAGCVAGLIVVAALLQCGSGHKIPPLTITTAALPNGTAGTQYSEQVQATGGVGPYNWGLGAGTLPANLQLQSNGSNTATISGTPDTPIQNDPFTMKVSDSANQSASQPYKVSILALPDRLTLSPASLNFNAQLDGTTSGTQSATLTNTGNTAVAINGVAPSGNNAGDFSQSNTCLPSLAAGANCGITVTFRPVQAGPRVAAITINDDTEGSPHQLGLNGIGLSPGANATLSATSLTFSGQEVGTTSPLQTLTLTNYGEATLSIANVAASGNFSESNNCAPTLAPGANCPINVSFSPATAGALIGSLTVNDDSTGSPQTVTLSGSGVSGGTFVLNGLCENSDPALGCDGADDLAECPAGVVATTPASLECLTNTVTVDNSRTCSAKNRRRTVTGWCEAVPATASSRIALRKSCYK